MNVTVVPGAMLLISTVVVLSGAGVVLSAGAVGSAGSTAGWVAPWLVPTVPSRTPWAAAMVANTSTAMAEGGITYIRRFIRAPPTFTLNFSTDANKSQTFKKG